MNPNTSREVVIAEALGDFQRLFDRIDAVQPRLDESTQRIEHTTADVSEGVESFRQRVEEFCSKHAREAAANASRTTGQYAVKVFTAQTEELKKSAQLIFDKEVTPPLRKLTTDLQAAIRQAHRPWDLWLTHAATGVGASVLSTLLAVFLVRPGRNSLQQPPSAEPPVCVQPAPAPEKVRARK